MSGTFERYLRDIPSFQDTHQVFNFHFYTVEVSYYHENLYDDHTIKNTTMMAKLLSWKQQGILNYVQICNCMYTTTEYTSIF
jgi:hypothetical protein